MSSIITFRHILAGLLNEGKSIITYIPFQITKLQNLVGSSSLVGTTTSNIICYWYGRYVRLLSLSNEDAWHTYKSMGCLSLD